MSSNDILVVGGYGEVGRRLVAQLEATQPNRVVVAGRHPEKASGVRARRLDVDDVTTIEAALDGVGVVVACVRQSESHLLRAAVRRGIAYTSIAPPWLPPSETDLLAAEARRTGARVILAAGLEPGITSVLVRAGARMIRSTLIGRGQATATAVGVGAIADALWSREMDAPGVWLAEQVVAAQPFLARLAAQGIVPTTEDVVVLHGS